MYYEYEYKYNWIHKCACQIICSRRNLTGNYNGITGHIVPKADYIPDVHLMDKYIICIRINFFQLLLIFLFCSDDVIRWHHIRHRKIYDSRLSKNMNIEPFTINIVINKNYFYAPNWKSFQTLLDLSDIMPINSSRCRSSN